MNIEEHFDRPELPDPDIAAWLCKEIPSDANPSGINSQFICDKELDALFAKTSYHSRSRGAHSHLLRDLENHQRQSLLEQHVE